MKIVDFNSEAETIAFQKLAWIATVKKAIDDGDTAKNPSGDLITDYSSLTDDEIAALKICGHIGNDLQTNNGTTVSYAIVSKAYQIEKWYVPAPIGLMDLTGYDVIDLPQNWLPPEP